MKLQNEELRNAQVELGTSRDRYTGLHESAPLAYVTLNKDGAILESNLMAAKVLGGDRRDLVRAKLAKFVLGELQDDWYIDKTDRQMYSVGNTAHCQTLGTKTALKSRAGLPQREVLQTGPARTGIDLPAEAPENLGTL